MEVLKDRYTITELSERLKVTDHTLRFYEKEFNLAVPRDSRGRRFYPTALANIMYQIKTMRDEGLEIKAIKKMIDIEYINPEPPPVILDNSSEALIELNGNNNPTDIRQFFNEFKEQITGEITNEVASAKDYLAREIGKTKLELGACVENSVRKLETKLEKHFAEVDRSIGIWRDKNKGNALKRFMNRIFK